MAIAVSLQSSAAGAVAGMEETSVQALTKVIGLMPPRLRRQMDALRSQTERLPWSGGPAVDADAAHHAGAGLPRRRAAALHLHRKGQRADRALGRAAPDGLASAAAGTSSPTTATARTGAPSASTGSASHAPPASGSGRASCPPRTRSPSSRRASAGCRSGTTCACVLDATVEQVAAGGRPLGPGQRDRRPGGPRDERRLARLAADGAGQRRAPTSPSSRRRAGRGGGAGGGEVRRAAG